MSQCIELGAAGKTVEQDGSTGYIGGRRIGRSGHRGVTVAAGLCDKDC